MSLPPSRGIVDPYLIIPEVASFDLRSTDIQEGEPLPAAQYQTYAGGENRSPQLSWSNAPEGTKSFAVTCYDPDAPTGSGFWHWAVINIPGSVSSLPADAGAPGSDLLPEGSLAISNELREPGYTGAAPPEGTGVHRYWFVVHALDVERVEVDPSVTPAVMGFMMREHVIGRAVLVATGEFGQGR